jgi:predicted CoA-substrate-specific enzyme activase
MGGLVAINIGLDIGAISVKLAALGEREDAAAFAALCAGTASYRVVAFGDAPLVLSEYRRIAGSPIQAAYDVLREFYEGVPAERIHGIRVTGSGSRTIAEILGLFYENEFKAIARMMAAFHPEVRTVFELGGESSKYLALDGASIVDYDRSGECAAGTGSFIDQQAMRMRYAVEEVGAVVATAGKAAPIAGRCSVFARSDMIHAQQRGYTPAEILRGLCDAVARNFKGSVVKGRKVASPVALIGAVSQNAGVRDALARAFRLGEGELVVPEHYAWGGAIGAAILEAAEKKKRTFRDIHELRQHGHALERVQQTPVLSMDRVLLLRDRVATFRPPPDGAAIPAYLGIDVGSVSTNVVVTDGDGTLVHEIYLRTAGRPMEAVQQGLTEVAERWGARLDIRGVGTTGSGRELVAEYVGADVVNDEITAHKTGAWRVCQTLGIPPVDTIFEIGGQDSKFISIENGVVVDFAMNEACAAGTGSFLEEQAEKLGISVKEEFARLALSAQEPTRLGERCTVFMERDVTGWMHKGETVPNLLAGLSYSIALNYLNRVVRGRRIGDVIFFQGGTAYNDAVAAAFAGLLGKRVIVPPHNGVIGAIGMALIAREWHRATGERTRFRGYDLAQLQFTTRDFVCKACSNLCDMKEFVIEGQRSYWGDKCSDKFRKPSVTHRKPVIEDLVTLREQLLADLTAAPPAPAGRRRLKVGLSRAIPTAERLPFWHRYLVEVGFEPVLSPPTDPAIAASGVELAIAQPCYPIQVAHGHVQALLEKGVDYVLLPTIADAESEPGSELEAHYCPWNQTLPHVLRSAPALEPHQARFLIPTVHFQVGPAQVKRALAETMQRLGVTRRASDRAVDAAYAAQREFQAALLEAGRRALAVLRETGEPGLVLMGRAYNLYDRGINCDIPRKLRHRYGANVIPLDFLVTGTEAVGDLHPNMYWVSGRRILAAAREAGATANLHVVYVTNFKCGPDSYIKRHTRRAAGAPLLVLEFDGHGNDAGYMTRCEAYLDSKGILRCYQPSSEAPALTATR